MPVDHRARDDRRPAGRGGTQESGGTEGQRDRGTEGQRMVEVEAEAEAEKLDSRGPVMGESITAHRADRHPPS